MAFTLDARVGAQRLESRTDADRVVRYSIEPHVDIGDATVTMAS
jgi:hypothetical protein